MGAAHALFNLPSTTTIVSQFEERPKPNSTFYFLKPRNLKNPWLGSNLSLRSSSQRDSFPQNRSVIANVSLSLPTMKPEGSISSEKVPKWSRSAIKSFAMAELEARKLKYPTTGTEALLMGILIEGTSLASQFLRANGITLFKVREETVKLLGKADMYYFSPEHPPLTDDAKKALDWAVDKKLKSGNNGEITTAHLLLGIWSQVESPGHKMMAPLGFNEDKAKELEVLNSERGNADR